MADYNFRLRYDLHDFSRDCWCATVERVPGKRRDLTPRVTNPAPGYDFITRKRKPKETT